MNRIHFTLILILGFAFLGSGVAVADDIGTGKPNSTTQSTQFETDDDIGTGSWSEQLLQWFESDDSE